MIKFEKSFREMKINHVLRIIQKKKKTNHYSHYHLI